VTIAATTLEGVLSEVRARMEAALRRELERNELEYVDLRDAAFEYLVRGGKHLRPLLVFLSAGAAGNPALRIDSLALAVEVFHTWTLIHDDVIDHDALRRGGPTVHVAYRDRLLASAPEVGERAADYGRALAILAGDYLQGLAVRLVLEGVAEGVPWRTVHRAAEMMQRELLRDLVEGEMWDVTYTTRPILAVSHDELLGMYRRKSASLLGYCARAGCMFATGATGSHEGLAGTLGDFAEACGIAFQIQDDILGIVGDEAKLGKPVGSDIREGKRTTILRAAYERANSQEQKRIDAIVGRRDAGPEEVAEVRRILESTGGLEQARSEAERIVDRALEGLSDVPASVYRDRLADWARLLVTREV
jgi:geranylgeranyl diphosphate synthase type I